MQIPTVVSLALLVGLSPTLAAPCPDELRRSEGPHERIDVIFALDTTASMSGMIQTAKDKIWSIAAAVASAEPAPELRVGIVAYRDRSDDYVTQHVPLAGDLDLVYEHLRALRAAGGGDTPESVNQALHEAVEAFDGRASPGTLRLLFLVGDAPPNTSYRDDVHYSQSCALARQRGIVIHALQCGDHAETRKVWSEIAADGGGAHLQLPQSGGTSRTVETPYDDMLAIHAGLIDTTRIGYGDAEAQRAHERRVERSREIREGSSAEALADRAEYLGTESGMADLNRGGDLLGDLAEGRVKLEDVPEAQLPPRLRKVPPKEREQYLDDLAARRRGLREEIAFFTAKRQEYIDKHRARTGDDFDSRVLDLLRCQGVGIR